MNLFNELRRRNVLRMAGLYLVGAWLVVQVAGTLLPMFGAPDWVARSIVILLAIGFPAALVFAWVFELTPEGLKRDAEVQSAESIAPQTARRMDRMIIVLLALALGYFAVDKFVLAPQRAASVAAASSQNAEVETQASIAVLPFVNMSTDADNGFFADGISEELLNVFAGIQGLKVASRTSSFSFRGKDTAIPEIARQLGVRYVLEGSVRRQGERVRVTAQLIHAGSDGHLWSETYDRNLTDIFKVQEEIAQSITRELEDILGKRAVTVTASTQDMQAYQNFLRGRARFHRREELLEAIEDLTAAVKQDPNFGEAWVYLAATWWVAPGYHDEDEVQQARARAESRAAVERAAQLAPSHPMVPALQAALLEDEGRLTESLALMEESVKRSVQDSTPLMWRGVILLRAGYVAEAIAALEDARDMDPLAGINNGYLAIAYQSAGRDEEAEASARKARSQGWDPAIQVIVYDLSGRGERERALALWDELIAPSTEPEDATRAAAIRELLRDTNSASHEFSLRSDSSAFEFELNITARRYGLVFDQAEAVMQQDPEERRRQWWLRSAWLPSTLALREDPRFYALAEGLGMVRLWQTRGWPDGCKRVTAASGDHLDCAGDAP